MHIDSWLTWYDFRNPVTSPPHEILPHMHPFGFYLLCTYYVTGTALDTGDTQYKICSVKNLLSVGCIHTHTHTHNGILCSHKKSEILPFAAAYMNLEILILNEVKKRKKYHVISFICGI